MKGFSMGIEKLSFKGSEINSQVKQRGINFKGENNYSENPQDKEKSNASKLMLGATALAGVVAIGIAGYKGYLGKGIQKFLGSVKNSNIENPFKSVENMEKWCNENGLMIKNKPYITESGNTKSQYILRTKEGYDLAYYSPDLKRVVAKEPFESKEKILKYIIDNEFSGYLHFYTNEYKGNFPVFKSVRII